MDRQSFRILSLDGGGIRGAYTAAVLAQIEENTGKRVVEHFDLVAGTSTGGIIALALGLGRSAREILDFYKRHGPAIFPSTGMNQRLWARMRRFVAPKFSSRALVASLREMFADGKLGDSQCRLVIPSYDAVAGDVHVFKTAHHARVLEDHKRDAVEVALATSAAPTYLPMLQSTWGQQLLDGGVWANCPSTIAVLEAIAVLGIRCEDIDLLSIGTTSEPFSIDRRAAGGGFMQFRLSVIDLLMQAQEVAAHAQSKLLLTDRMYRINAIVARKRFALDDARSIDALIALGMKDGRHHATQVGERFFAVQADAFTPQAQVRDSEAATATGTSSAVTAGRGEA